MSNTEAISIEKRSFGEKVEPYLSFLGPMAMIAAVLLFMGVVEPARYFRLSNLNQILLDAAPVSYTHLTLPTKA